MKLKSCLCLFLLLFTLTISYSQDSGCVCFQCDDANGICTVSGYNFSYPDQQTCFNNEPSCGGIPINSNSWVLLVMGASVLVVGFVVTRKAKQIQ